METALESVRAAPDALSLEDWVNEYGDSVLQLAYLYLKDRDLAEDVFQEVFTRAYTRRHTFRGESSPRTWLYRITVNLCRDKLRSWTLRRLVVAGEELIALMAPSASDVEEQVLAQADRSALLEAVMALPVAYREVVLLYYYEEMETAEVAEALGLSQGTVRSRLHRARARLKAMLEGGRGRD
jgi:RNA polymerase sigma-70 factor (ECF subfamily)